MNHITKGWESLGTRRSKHKLALVYKMNNNISPDCLSSLVPQSVETTTHYSLRDATNIRQPLTRTQLYYNPFIPSSTRLWNDLPVGTRDSNTFTSFKYQINKNLRRPPKYYTVGDGFAQIQHTFLRTYCSSLNQHLSSKNIINDPYCFCGSGETTKNYLLECQSYSAARLEMINRISRYHMPNLNCLLFGDNHLNHNSNSEIFFCSAKVYSW